jgi:hypothetical protein
MKHIGTVSRVAPAQITDDPFKIQIANIRRDLLCSLGAGKWPLNQIFEIRC